MIAVSPQDALLLIDRPDTLFVDTRSAAKWAEATIPGAVHLDAYAYFIRESTEEGVRAMVCGLRAAFGTLGAERAQRVIFFEDETGMISPRALWFHELCGLAGGMILDGGLFGWREAGGDVAPGQGISVSITDGDGTKTNPFRDDLIATLAEVQGRQDDAILLDTRDPEEWDGTFAHACCPRAGRLPGAQYLFYEHVLEGGRFRAPEEIRRIAVDAGLTPDRNIVLYCHRGARAATVAYGLRLAGFNRLSIYTGGWHEWAGNPALEAEATDRRR